MNRTTLEGYEQLGRALVWAAGVVLVLGIVGAIIIAGSDDALPLFEDVLNLDDTNPATYLIALAGIVVLVGAITFSKRQSSDMTAE